MPGWKKAEYHAETGILRGMREDNDIQEEYAVEKALAVTILYPQHLPACGILP